MGRRKPDRFEWSKPNPDPEQEEGPPVEPADYPFDDPDVRYRVASFIAQSAIAQHTRKHGRQH